MSSSSTTEFSSAVVRHVLSIENGSASANFKAASGYLVAGSLFAAQSYAEQAVKLNPTFAEAWNLLGKVYEQQNNVDGAIDAYAKAAVLTPLYEAPRASLARLCNSHRRPSPHIPEWPKPSAPPKSVVATVTLDADEAKLRLLLAQGGYNSKHLLGLSLLTMSEDRLDEAQGFADFVLSVEPLNTDALLILSQLAEGRKQFDEAFKFALRASDSHPENAIAAVQAMSFALEIGMWARYSQLHARALSGLARQPGAAQPAEALFFVSDPKVMAECGRAWASHVLLRRQRKPIYPKPHVPAAHVAEGKLTIGYISADFHIHPIGRLAASFMRHHDREKFRIRSYSLWPADEDVVRKTIREASDSFAQLYGLAAETAAEHIATDGVDILVDLTGYTLNCRTDILALQPSPIQVNYAGYLGTMGAEFMQYQIADQFVAANPQHLQSTEKLIRLPMSLLSGDDHQLVKQPGVMTRQQAGLPDAGVVFCNFSNVNRLNPETFECWMRILRRVKGSVLWLVERSAESRVRLQQQAVIAGIDSRRLIFMPRVSYDEYLQRLTCADLFLDTLPHNAGAVALDTLWMGCPLLTCPGDVFQSRIGHGLVNTLGLPELSVSTREEYEDTAVRLALDPAALQDLKLRLAQARTASALFNPALMIRHLEWAYQAMWETHLKGEGPRQIDVPWLGNNNA